MSANSSLNPQVGASASDVWQQFFREALRKRSRAAAEANESPAATAELHATIGDAALAADATDAEAAALDGAALDDESPRARLSLSPLEMVALVFFGASVFCFVSLLLYDPGDYFDAEILRTRAEVSFGVGKTIFRPFGLAVYSLLAFTLFWSGAVFFRHGVRGIVLKSFGIAVVTTALAGLLGLAFPGEDGAGTLVHGGVVGEFLARRMTASFDTLGATALLILVSLISLIFATDWFFTSLAREGSATALDADEDEDDDPDDSAADGAEVADADEVDRDVRDRDAIPVVGKIEAAPETEASSGDSDEMAVAAPVTRPSPVARRRPEPTPIDEPAPRAESAGNVAPDTEAPAADEREAARILSRAVRASTATRRRERPSPEFLPVAGEDAAEVVSAPEPAREFSTPPAEPDGLEPPPRSATERPRLRWRRRDENAVPEPEFGAGLRDETSAVSEPASAHAPGEDTPISFRTPEGVSSLDLDDDPAPPAPATAVARGQAFGLEDPEDEAAEDEPVGDREPSAAVESEPDDVAAPESPSSAPPRKAQLSLFDEVIDEISKAGRESRSSAPRRPSSPIPPAPAPAVPTPIDAATYDRAVRVVLEAGRGSVSLLQRRLDVGYVTANRLLDLMEHDGVVGEHRGGSGPREVRTTIDEWMQRKPSGPTPS